MKTALTMLLACLSSAVNATTYYFSASGNDARTAAEAQNSATPWKTLSKLNSFFGNLKPGDSVLLKRGEIFHGQIKVIANGTKGNPITIGTYGEGDQPVITSLPALKDFTRAGSGIYSKNVKLNAQTIIYEDGVPLLPMATSPACADGRWFADNVTFYYRPTSGIAANHIVTTVPNWLDFTPGVDVSNSSYITIDGLSLNSCGSGIKSYDVSGGTVGITIQNCSFKYCHTGIMMMPDKWNNNSTVIKNCFFYRCQNGIRLYTTSCIGDGRGTNNSSNVNCIISNNEMFQIGKVNETTNWSYGPDLEAIGLQNFIYGTISDNYIHEGYEIGVGIYTLATMSSSNNKISGNKFINNGKWSLEFNGDDSGEGNVANYSFNNNVISNNLFSNQVLPSFNYDGNIIIYQGAKTTKMNYFINNTLSGPKNIIDITTSRPPFFVIKNNIFRNPGQRRFVGYYISNKTKTLEMDYNIYYEESGESYGWQLAGPGKSVTEIRAFGFETNSKIINPLFMNAEASDFRLRAFSPAIDAGQNVGLPFKGNKPDIGAYELGMPSTINLSAIPENIKCNGDSTTLTVSATAGKPPYQYSINGGDFLALEKFTVVSGTHTIKVRDANNDTASKTVLITEPKKLIAQVYKTDVSRYNFSDGYIKVAASGGLEPYVYKFHSDTAYRASNIFDGLKARSYIFYIKDANGCVVFDSVKLEQPAPLKVATVTKTNVSCNGKDGSATVTGSGGKIPYQYNLDGGYYQSGNTFTGMMPGEHTIRIKDSSGVIVARNITITKSTPLSAVISNKQISCQNNYSRIYTTATGGKSPYLYKLVPDSTGMSSNYQSNRTFTVLPGRYQVVVKDSKACEDTSDILTINKNEPVMATLSTTGVTCSGNADGSVTINATGGTEPYMYKVANASYQYASTFTNLAVGEYELFVKDANGCTVPKMRFSIEKMACHSTTAERPADKPGNDNKWDVVIANPTVSAFRLAVKNSTYEPVNIRVFDLYGKKVYEQEQPGQNLSYLFGNTLIPGIYIIQVRQGANYKTVQVVKEL